MAAIRKLVHFSSSGVHQIQGLRLALPSLQESKIHFFFFFPSFPVTWWRNQPVSEMLWFVKYRTMNSVQNISQKSTRSVLSSGILRLVAWWKSTDVSEEHGTSIFRVEEWVRQETSMHVSCLAYTLTLKMEVTCSSEASVGFQRTTLRYIPEESTLHNHRYENLISHEEGKIWRSTRSVLTIVIPSAPCYISLCQPSSHSTPSTRFGTLYFLYHYLFY
jgi:hypothetical protein